MSENSPLEQVWKYREEIVYPSLFGPISRGTFVLSSELFTDVFAQETVDPRWLHYGVIEFAPTLKRNSWIYISTGASNPWELEPEQYSESEFSGFGTEIVLETAEQADWAIIVLQRALAFNILLAHGRYGNKPTLDYGDRIPLGSPITLQGDSRVRNLIATKPSHYDDHFRLESGRVDLLHLVGATDREMDFAKENGSAELTKLLGGAGFVPVTVVDRGDLPGI